jgi:hypothetical protein
MKLDPETLHLAWVADAVAKLLERRRGEANLMLESCGIDPRTVPLWPEIWREGSRVHLERFMYDERGRPRRDDHDWMFEEFTIEPDRIPHWIPFG